MGRTSWFVSYPALYSQVQAQLRAEFRTLRLSAEDGKAYVRGALPICGVDGSELSRFQIEIELSDDFPRSVPVVRETAGKIPKDIDRHVNHDGTACLFVRDETWKYWNKRSTLIDFIKGPVYQFFIGQIYYAEHSAWPFGQRNHFGLGVAEYYFEELGTTSLFVVQAFLEFLSARNLDTRKPCYCGSFSQLRKCHQFKLLDLRSKIPANVATVSLRQVRRLIEQLPKPKRVYSVKTARSLSLRSMLVAFGPIRKRPRF